MQEKDKHIHNTIQQQEWKPAQDCKKKWRKYQTLQNATEWQEYIFSNTSDHYWSMYPRKRPRVADDWLKNRAGDLR